MSLISLIVVLVVIGLIMYGVNHYLPLDPGIKKIINIVVIIVVCIWLLALFGVLPDLNVIRVGG